MEAELIERRAVRGVGARGGEGRADSRRVDRLTVAAVSARTRLLACGRIRQVRALSRGDAVRRRESALRRTRRLDVVVEPAVLVVRPEEDRVVPAGAGAERVDDLRHDVLARADVVGG